MEEVGEYSTIDFFNSAPQAMMLLNEAGYILEVNHLAKKVLEPAAHDISVGMPFSDIIWFRRGEKGTICKEDSALLKAIKEGEPIKDTIRALRLKHDGYFLWLKISACAIGDTKTSKNNIMVCLHDISQEVAMQEALNHRTAGQQLFLKISRRLHYLREDHEIEQVLKEILHEAGQMFHSDRCFLYHHKANRILSKGFFTCEQGDYSPNSFLSSQKLFQTFKEDFEKGEKEAQSFWLIDDMKSKVDFFNKYKEEEGLKTSLVLPILSMKQECVGILGFETIEQTIAFNPTDGRGVEFLADIIGAFFDRYLKAWNLRERVKEMRCLDQVNQLILNNSAKFQDYLQDLVNLIPPGFLYPDKTLVRLKAGDLQVESGKLKKPGKFHQKGLKLRGYEDCFLEVFLEEGLKFLKEEFDLIERIATAIEREWERSENLRELEINHERLQHLAESEKFYVIRVNMQGEVTHYSSKYAEDNRWILEELGRKGMQNHMALDTICDYHHELTQETVAKCLASPGKIYSVILDKPAPNDTIRHTFWEFVALVNENGEPKEVQCMGIDITDIEQSKRTLERFKEISDSSTNASLISDINGNLEYVNEQFCRLTGLKKEDIINREGTAIFHPDFYEERQAIRKELAEKGSVENREVDFKFSNGKRLTFLFTARVIKSARGNWIYYSLLDIDQRKKQEIQLREQKQRLQAVLEAIPDSIFVLDRQGTYLEYYPGTHESVTDQSHLIGLHVYDAHKPNYAEEMLAKIELCIQERRAQKMRYSRKLSTGRNWYEVTFTMIDENRVLKLVQNITFQKEHEEQLQRFNIAIQQSPVGIIITGLEGYIEYASPSMEKISGYSPKQLEGMSTRLFSSGKNDPELYKALWSTIKNGESWEGELLNKNRDQVYYWERLSITPIKNADSEIYKYMALKQNVDKERKTQQQLIKQKEIFRDIAHAQSHEVRAPLARILGLIEVMKTTPLHDDDLRRELMDKLLISGEELDTIIRLTVEKVKEAEKMYD